MTLTQFMADHDLDDEKFAALVGCSKFGVSKWRRGERFPRVEQLIRIAEVTNNTVMPHDFFGSVSIATGDAA